MVVVVFGVVVVLGAVGLTGEGETLGMVVVEGAGAGVGMVVTGGAVAAGGGMAVDGVEGVAPAGVWLRVAPVLTPAEVALREVAERWGAAAKVVDRLRTTGAADAVARVETAR
ncbi:MAG: hypothetical protein JWP73_174 [Phenylobacterium sp.]|nr:hypothetical protein [Phenylobacterium sp.]